MFSRDFFDRIFAYSGPAGWAIAVAPLVFVLGSLPYLLVAGPSQQSLPVSIGNLAARGYIFDKKIFTLEAWPYCIEDYSGPVNIIAAHKPNGPTEYFAECKIPVGKEGWHHWNYPPLTEEQILALGIQRAQVKENPSIVIQAPE